MTPPATTPAGREAAGRARPAPAVASGHRRSITQGPAPRSSRRVSGPVSRAAMAAPATVPAWRPGAVPKRLVIEPSRVGERALERLRALPDSRWLDRLVRGRAWIPVLGVMLVGIVFMQVEVLKLGAGIGRSIQQTEALQSRNELLREQVTTLADDQRIERLAAGQGMVMPAPGDIGFLSARGVDPRRAVGSVRAPNPSGFLTLLSNNASVTRTPVPPGAQPGTGGTAAAGSSGASPAAASPGPTAATAPTPGSVTPTSTTPSTTGG